MKEIFQVCVRQNLKYCCVGNEGLKQEIIYVNLKTIFHFSSALIYTNV